MDHHRILPKLSSGNPRVSAGGRVGRDRSGRESVMKDLRKMNTSWDEVEEAAEDRKSWWNCVAQCVFDVNWTRNQDLDNCATFRALTLLVGQQKGHLACKELRAGVLVVVVIALLLLRLTPLRVRSATGCQQPPEWSVLAQVDCIGPWQPVGVEVILHRLHPGHPRSSWWSHPIHGRRGSQDLLCVYIVVHSGDMPE